METACKIQRQPALFAFLLTYSEWILAGLGLAGFETPVWCTGMFSVALIFPTLYHFQIFLFPFWPDFKASELLSLCNFDLVWHTVCAIKVPSAGGVSGYSSAASGMVFYGWLVLNGVHTQRWVLRLDVLTHAAFRGRRTVMKTKNKWTSLLPSHTFFPEGTLSKIPLQVRAWIESCLIFALISEGHMQIHWRVEKSSKA